MFPVVATVVIIIVTHLFTKDLRSSSYVSADVPGTGYFMVSYTDQLSDFMKQRM